MTRARNCGLAAAALISAIAACPRPSLAGFSGYGPGYGASASVSVQNVPESQSGGPGFTFASAGVTGLAANASLLGGGMSARASFDVPDFVDEGSYDAAGTLYDTVTTGIVPAGATMTLSAFGTEDVTQLAADDGILSEGVGLGFDVYQGSVTSNPWATARESISAVYGDTSILSYESLVGYDGTNSGANSSDLTSTPLWLGTISSTFDVSSDTQYMFVLTGGASVSAPEYYSNLGAFEATLDPPVWSLSTSPGVTYTTASGIPIGGDATAPEPSSCALLLPALGALCAAAGTTRAKRNCSDA